MQKREQCPVLWTILWRWVDQVTPSCFYSLMHSRVYVSLRKKAQVCSGRGRFNIMKPNYTWPAIALYPFIESTELARESSHFSRVNKKSSAVRENMLETSFYLAWSQFHTVSAVMSAVLVYNTNFSPFWFFFFGFFNSARFTVPVPSCGSWPPGQPANVWVAETQREAISGAAARGKGRQVKCHNPPSL